MHQRAAIQPQPLLGVSQGIYMQLPELSVGHQLHASVHSNSKQISVLRCLFLREEDTAQKLREHCSPLTDQPTRAKV
jgi:hypothetical protein